MASFRSICWNCGLALVTSGCMMIGPLMPIRPVSPFGDSTAYAVSLGRRDAAKQFRPQPFGIELITGTAAFLVATRGETQALGAGVVGVVITGAWTEHNAGQMSAVDPPLDARGRYGFSDSTLWNAYRRGFRSTAALAAGSGEIFARQAMVSVVLAAGMGNIVGAFVRGER